MFELMKGKEHQELVNSLLNERKQYDVSLLVQHFFIMVIVDVQFHKALSLFSIGLKDEVIQKIQYLLRIANALQYLEETF
jgi:hypothetical protein